VDYVARMGDKNTKHTPFYWKHVTQQTVRTYAKMSYNIKMYFREVQCDKYKVDPLGSG